MGPATATLEAQPPTITSRTPSPTTPLMPVRPCLDCGRASSSTRCPSCRRAKDRGRNHQRTHYQHGWTKRSKDTRDAWVAEHGWWCPGNGGHDVEPGGLQLDHTTGLPLCGPCNVNAGPAGPDAAIPH